MQLKAVWIAASLVVVGAASASAQPASAQPAPEVAPAGSEPVEAPDPPSDAAAGDIAGPEIEPGAGWASEGEAREWELGKADAGKKGKKADKGKKGKKADKGKKGKKGKKNEVVVGGRIFFLGTWSRTDLEAIDDDPWVQELAVSSARITADYRRKRYLKVMVEADFAGGKAALKDGYVRIRPRAELTIEAGRFKRPMSAIALESAWRLPSIERGLLSSLEPSTSVGLPFGGRGDGVAVAYRLRNVVFEPTLTASLFAHEVAGNVIDVSEHFALDPYFRVDLSPADGVDVGVSMAVVTHQKRRRDLDVLNHAPVAGVDLVVRRGPLELWLEGFYGSSTIFTPAGVTGGELAATRAIIAVRFEDLAPWLAQLGPFVIGSLFDPNLDRGGDRGYQLGGGVLARFDKALRLQIQVEQTWIDDVDLLLTSDRLAATLQLGAAF